MMIEFVIKVVVLMVAVPLAGYFTVKLGVYAYLRAIEIHKKGAEDHGPEKKKSERA